ncbi:hypothetical protein [Rhizohabitans arisaemae]|nr:hypothetical protein [Rhizohabitans arisaemae]
MQEFAEWIPLAVAVLNLIVTLIDRPVRRPRSRHGDDPDRDPRH